MKIFLQKDKYIDAQPTAVAIIIDPCLGVERDLQCCPNCEMVDHQTCQELFSLRTILRPLSTGEIRNFKLPH